MGTKSSVNRHRETWVFSIWFGSIGTKTWIYLTIPTSKPTWVYNSCQRWCYWRTVSSITSSNVLFYKHSNTISSISLGHFGAYRAYEMALGARLGGEPFSPVRCFARSIVYRTYPSFRGWKISDDHSSSQMVRSALLLPYSKHISDGSILTKFKNTPKPFHARDLDLQAGWL